MSVLSFSISHLRCYALFAAIFLYGTFRSPTPDAIGWVEISVGALLVFASGFDVLTPFFRSSSQTAIWQKTGAALLIFGLSLPVLIGIASGNDPRLILRDVVPFLFLLLPIFLIAPFKKEPDFRWVLTFITATTGVFFASRVVLPFLFVRGGFVMSAPADPAYMANAPTVLFAALFFAALSGRTLYASLKLRSVIVSLFFLACVLFPLAAMILIVQRAHVGLVALGLGLLLIGAFIRAPIRAMRPLFLLTLCALCVFPVMQQIGFHVLAKTESVGFNMRFEEAAAVLNALGDSLLSILFGHGWGATVASPAVGGVTVNFTHSLLTTYLLKTGFIGLCLTLAYLAALAWRLPTIFRRDPVIAIALTAPLIVDVLLYASFKSLDFGLILLLIAIWGQPHSAD